MPKDSLLSEKINLIIRRSLETGLFNKWMSDSFQQKKHPNEKVGNFRFKLENIAPAFIGYFVFLSLAIGAAIAEQIIYWRVHKPHHHVFWEIAEYFIDNDRHEFLFTLFWNWIRRKKKANQKIIARLQKIRRNKNMWWSH